MKNVNDLKDGDRIAFQFRYNRYDDFEIFVARITKVYKDEVLVHFLYGHKSLSEFIHKDDIIAIENSEGIGKIQHYSGNFDIIKLGSNF